MQSPVFSRSLTLAAFLGSAVAGTVAIDAVFARQVEAGYQIDESYFYVSLSSHGSWAQNAQFGWVWYPRHRPLHWRPYTVGRWAWTDYGDWLWISDEPFGWATYHYGRWYLDPVYGWAWIPGRVWAPAWVSWRVGGGYIGWSPLSPWGYWDSYRNCYRDRDRYHRGGYHDDDHDYHRRGDRDDRDYHGRHDGDDRDDRNDHAGGRGDRGDRGDDGRDGRDYDRDRRYRHNEDTWTFTRERDFTRDRIDKVAVDRRHAPEILRRSQDLPAPTREQERAGRGVTQALDRGVIERASGRPIRPVRVEDGDRPLSGSRRESGTDRVEVYRPQVRERPANRTPDSLGVAAAPAPPAVDHYPKSLTPRVPRAYQPSAPATRPQASSQPSRGREPSTLRPQAAPLAPPVRAPVTLPTPSRSNANTDRSGGATYRSNQATPRSNPAASRGRPTVAAPRRDTAPPASSSTRRGGAGYSAPTRVPGSPAPTRSPGSSFGRATAPSPGGISGSAPGSFSGSAPGSFAGSSPAGPSGSFRGTGSSSFSGRSSGSFSGGGSGRGSGSRGR